MTIVADPAAIAAVQDILKEVFPSDVLEDQLLNDTVILDWVDDVTEYTDSDGLKASVPLRVGRTGGISSRGIGQTLGAAGHQRVAKASYNYTFHYLQVKVLGPVIARMKTNRQACVREIDLEVQNGLDDLKQDWQRQIHGSGDAVLCRLDDTGSSTTVTVTDAHGPSAHAIDVGWVYEGQNVSIGLLNTSGHASPGVFTKTGDRTIQTVDPDAYTFTVDSAIDVPTAGANQIAVAIRYDNRLTGTDECYELNGLGNIAGDDTAEVGGLDPATASYWKPTIHDNGAVNRANSLDLMMKLENAIRRKGGKTELIVGDLDQERRYYNILQPSVRYAGDKSLSGGNDTGLDFHGKKFVGDPHCLPNLLRFLNKKALQMYSAGEVAWQNQTTGGDILAWVQDEDAFVARAAKYFQLGTNKRNTLGTLADLLST